MSATAPDLNNAEMALRCVGSDPKGVPCPNALMIPFALLAQGPAVAQGALMGTGWTFTMAPPDPTIAGPQPLTLCPTCADCCRAIALSAALSGALNKADTPTG